MTRSIHIPFNDWELKIMLPHFERINCSRHGQVRMIDCVLKSDLAFSKEDEQGIFHLFCLLDHIVENIVDGKKEQPLEVSNASGQAFDGSCAIGLLTEKKQFPCQHDVTIPGYYNWRFEKSPEQGHINDLPVFNIHVERRFFVDVMADKFRDLNQNELWAMPNDTGVTTITSEGFQQTDSSPDTLPSGEPLPARVVINGFSFPGDTGLRILKLRNDRCPFPQWQEAWNVLTPLTFREITERIKDIERRRTAISFLGTERIISQVESKKICEETIEKLTTWVDANGCLKEHRFSDTYSLHRVSWKTLYGDLSADNTRRLNINQLQAMNQHFVKCNCTSTGKDYLIWVDLRQVYHNNHPEEDQEKLRNISLRRIEKMVDPIEAIAWTFETRLAKGSIEAIIRQGDCILMRPTIDPKLKQKRHLTGEEYRTLLRSES